MWNFYDKYREYRILNPKSTESTYMNFSSIYSLFNYANNGQNFCWGSSSSLSDITFDYNCEEQVPKYHILSNQYQVDPNQTGFIFTCHGYFDCVPFVSPLNANKASFKFLCCGLLMPYLVSNWGQVFRTLVPSSSPANESDNKDQYETYCTNTNSNHQAHLCNIMR